MNPKHPRQPCLASYSRKPPWKFSLPAIVLLTALGIGAGIVRHSVVVMPFFQNIFFLPIIITCINYPKQGLAFTGGISVAYAAIVFLTAKDAGLIAPVFINIVFFGIVAVSFLYLGKKISALENLLKKQQDEIEKTIEERTSDITRELGQTKRLVRAYRNGKEFYDRGISEINISFVQFNLDLYITYINRTFEKLIGRSSTEIIGRKLASIPFLDEAFRSKTDEPVRVEIQSSDNETHTVLWMFSEIVMNGTAVSSSIVGLGMEVGSMEQVK